MRRSLAIAALLSAAALAAPQQVRASSGHLLRVSVPAGSSLVDVSLPAGSVHWATLTVQGLGRYSVTYLEPLTGDGRLGTGAMLVDQMAIPKTFLPPAVPVAPHELDNGNRAREVRYGFVVSIKKGRFRVHVIADRPGQLSVRITGLPHDVALTARSKGRDSVVYRELPVGSTTVYANAVAATVPLPAPSTHALTVLGAVLATTGNANRLAATFDACRTPNQPAALPVCAQRDDDASVYYDASTRRFYSVPPVPVLLPGEATTRFAVFRYYQTPKPGTSLGISVASGDRPTMILAFGATLSLH